MHRVSMFVFGLLLCSCATSQSLSSGMTGNLDILEAVVRYHFSDERYSAEKAYLSIAGDDPSKGFLNKFGNLNTKVRPGSEHELGKKPYLLEIQKVEANPGKAFVDAQDYHDGFFWIQYRFELSEKDGRWTVDDAYKLER